MEDIKKLLNGGNISSAKSKLVNIIKNDPTNYDAIHFLGISFLIENKPKESIQFFLKSIDIKKDFIPAYNNLGTAYAKIRKYQEALVVLEKAIEIDRFYFDINFNLAVIYFEIGMYSKCIDYSLISKGLIDGIDTDSIDLMISRSMSKLGNISYAIKYIEKIKNKKNNGHLYYAEKGNIYFKARDFVNAINCYNEFLKNNKNDSGVNQNIAICYASIAEFGKSVRHLEVSLKNSNHLNRNGIIDTLLFVQNYNPEITSDELKSIYLNYSENVEIINDLTIEKKEDTYFLNKIGFISSDFHRSSLSNFLLPFIEELSKVKQVFLINTGTRSDPITELYKSSNIVWLDLSKNTEHNSRLNEINKLGLDLLIETSGRGEGNQIDILRNKPAKKTMSWLGYGFSTGLKNIDYFFSDNIMIPEINKKFYIENKVITKNAPFGVYKPILDLASSDSPFVENKFITYGYLSRSIRLNDKIIQTIGKILNLNKNSRILFNYTDYYFKGMQDLILSKLQPFNIDKNRIIFRFDTPIDKALARIDIYLDSFPHNSGTTIIEALYCGVPVVTLQNDHIMGRLGASILCTIGKNEWIANTVDEYVNIASKLASNEILLLNNRKNLKGLLERSDLMNYKKFTNDFLTLVK